MDVANDRERILARFWPKVHKTESCWLWSGARTPPKDGSQGYGHMKIGGKFVYIHRLSHELFVGPIPPGLTIDHVKARGCASTLCVNPAHLEAVTMRVNVLRGNGCCARNARKLSCIAGHLFIDARDRAECRRCKAARNRLYKRKDRPHNPRPPPRSGFRGVKKVGDCRRWEARIGEKYLGIFKTPEEASIAYSAAVGQKDKVAKAATPL